MNNSKYKKSGIEQKAKKQIEKSKEVYNEAKRIINLERIKKKEQKNINLLNNAINNLNKSQKSYNDSKGYLRKSIEFYNNRDKEKSKEFAKKAKKYANKSRNLSRKVIRLKNRVEEKNKKLIKEFFTIKNITLIFLFLYTLFMVVILFFFSIKLREIIFEIFYKYFGRYYTAIFFLTALTIFSFCVVALMVVFVMYYLENKKMRWWFWITLGFMFFIGITGFLFVDMSIGQNNLDLFLRNQSMNQVGQINCRGSLDILLASDFIYCKINEIKLNNISGNVSFEISGNSNFSSIFYNFDDLNFKAPENVTYISFNIAGTDKNNNPVTLSSGTSYHFYTNQEYIDLKARFLRYLAAILSIIFVTTPIVIKTLKDIYKEDRENDKHI